MTDPAKSHSADSWRAMLRTRPDALLALVDMLIEKKILSADDVRRLLEEAPPFLEEAGEWNLGATQRHGAQITKYHVYEVASGEMPAPAEAAPREAKPAPAPKPPRRPPAPRVIEPAFRVPLVEPAAVFSGGTTPARRTRRHLLGCPRCLGESVRWYSSPLRRLLFGLRLSAWVETVCESCNVIFTWQGIDAAVEAMESPSPGPVNIPESLPLES